MKLVKKSISLPEDLFRFAEKQAEADAKSRGEPKNVSSYFRRLVQKQRQELETEKQAA